jgi:hypothetical protein
MYKLVNRVPVPCDDVHEAALSWEADQRRVALTTVGVQNVSTVFLGLDHRFGEGPPLLFETMVFGFGPDDERCERCSTWEEAEAQHERIVNELKEKNHD